MSTSVEFGSFIIGGIIIYALFAYFVVRNWERDKRIVGWAMLTFAALFIGIAGTVRYLSTPDAFQENVMGLVESAGIELLGALIVIGLWELLSERTADNKIDELSLQIEQLRSEIAELSASHKPNQSEADD